MGGRCRLGVGWRESGGKLDPQSRPDWAAQDRIVAGQGLCGRDRIRTCVGNAGDFTGRTAVASRVPSHPHLVPIIARDVHKWPADSFRRPPASLPVSPPPARPSVGRREVGGKSRPPAHRRCGPRAATARPRSHYPTRPSPMHRVDHRSERPRRDRRPSQQAGTRTATGSSTAGLTFGSTLQLLIEQHRDPLLPKHTLDQLGPPRVRRPPWIHQRGLHAGGRLPRRPLKMADPVRTVISVAAQESVAQMA
jgi:hypothetical protein